jgi:formylglycine-generating enzyme required for sulfatase activity
MGVCGSRWHHNFWWGAAITPAQANYDGNYTYAAGSKGEYRKTTLPVGNFAANPWGLYNVHGNVHEWCDGVSHNSYDGAPSDGSPWFQGGEQLRRVVRGGSWYDVPKVLRSANRASRSRQDNGSGFRLARTLP